MEINKLALDSRLAVVKVDEAVSASDVVLRDLAGKTYPLRDGYPVYIGSNTAGSGNLAAKVDSSQWGGDNSAFIEGDFLYSIGNRVSRYNLKRNVFDVSANLPGVAPSTQNKIFRLNGTYALVHWCISSTSFRTQLMDLSTMTLVGASVDTYISIDCAKCKIGGVDAVVLASGSTANSITLYAYTYASGTLVQAWTKGVSGRGNSSVFASPSGDKVLHIASDTGNYTYSVLYVDNVGASPINIASPVYPSALNKVLDNGNLVFIIAANNSSSAAVSVWEWPAQGFNSVTKTFNNAQGVAGGSDTAQLVKYGTKLLAIYAVPSRIVIDEYNATTLAAVSRNTYPPSASASANSARIYLAGVDEYRNLIIGAAFTGDTTWFRNYAVNVDTKALNVGPVVNANENCPASGYALSFAAYGQLFYFTGSGVYSIVKAPMAPIGIATHNVAAGGRATLLREGVINSLIGFHASYPGTYGTTKYALPHTAFNDAGTALAINSVTLQLHAAGKVKVS